MRILLGISGGIAAYKTPELVRAWTTNGHQVRCILTANASHMVAEKTLLTLSGHSVQRDLWPADDSIPHIECVRWCDVMVVAPATANCLAKFALGLADDLLSTCFLALEPHKPCFIAPAMNTVMWDKAIVQQHLSTLQAQGLQVIAPVAGNLACGEEGIGAMADPQDIARAVGAGEPS